MFCGLRFSRGVLAALVTVAILFGCLCLVGLLLVVVWFCVSFVLWLWFIDLVGSDFVCCLGVWLIAGFSLLLDG